jgi:hypothetical protein
MYHQRIHGWERKMRTRAIYRLRTNLQKKGNKSRDGNRGAREDRVVQDSRQLVSSRSRDFALRTFFFLSRVTR